MSAIERIDSLKQKHAKLEEDLAQEMKNATSNEATLNQLKRQKLAIKDEIEKLSKDSE